jgi:hypothetical protein
MKNLKVSSFYLLLATLSTLIPVTLCDIDYELNEPFTRSTLANYGTICTCKDSRRYYVAAKTTNSCTDFACEGGTIGVCYKSVNASWTNKGVDCGAQIRPTIGGYIMEWLIVIIMFVLCCGPWCYMWIYPFCCGGISLKQRHFNDMSDMQWLGMRCCPCIPLIWSWQKCIMGVEKSTEKKDADQPNVITEGVTAGVGPGNVETFFNERRGSGNGQAVQSPLMNMGNNPLMTDNHNQSAIGGPAGGQLPMMGTETAGKGVGNNPAPTELKPNDADYMPVADNSRIEERPIDKL